MINGASCGNCSGDDKLLARNGLAYGSTFFVQRTGTTSLPSSTSGTVAGTFGTSSSLGLYAPKFEDVSTNPNNPKQGEELNLVLEFLSTFSCYVRTNSQLCTVIIAEQTSGVYIFTFNLTFGIRGYFSATESMFTVRKISISTTDYDPDNVEWMKDGSILIQSDNSVGRIIRYFPNNATITNIAETTASGER